MVYSETTPGIHPDPDTSPDVNLTHNTNGVDTSFDFGATLNEAVDTEPLWEGKLGEFLGKAEKSPRLLRTSHARIADMIDERDVFTGIIGHEKPKAALRTYFRAAGDGSAQKDRIVILVGPTGSGKSSLGKAIKEGLQEYASGEENMVVTIKGCPVQESVLHAIPEKARPAVATKLQVPTIEGAPCACCQQKIDALGSNISSLEVQQVRLSEESRIGIVSVTPGSVGERSEVTVFSPDGATEPDWGKIYNTPPHKANRGVLEVVDFEKIDEDFLTALMSVSQEHVVNLPGYPPVRTDEVIIGHTNEEKFNTLLANNGGLKDRIVIINVPSSVKINDEKEIYEKELANSSKVHIAPMALEMAAMFAMATRVSTPTDTKISLIDKIRLLNGEQVDGYTEKTTQDLRDENAAQRDGMSGISTRFMVNALTRALDRNDGHCVNAVTALSAIQEEINAEPTFDKKKKEDYTKLVETVRAEFNTTIKTEVQSAFIEDFPKKAKKMFDDYYDNAEAYVRNRKLIDPITEDEVDPDEKFMRTVEETIGISENAKKAFRTEVFTLIAHRARQAARDGKKPEAIQKEVFTYTAHPKLRQAIEKVLLKDVFEVAKAVTTTKTPNEEQLEKIALAEGSLQEHGYCPNCSHDMLKYAGPLLTAA